MTGNYPFTVRIFNLFNPDLKVDVEIKRKHLRIYIRSIKDDKGNTLHGYFKDTPDNIPGDRIYTIQGGDSLAFPMYYKEDSLEISLKGTPNRKYCIMAGAKAKCYFSEDPGAPENATDQSGGTWTIDPAKNNWKLRIVKYDPDPEDDDIVIGEDPPE